MKRLILLLCGTILTLSLAACGGDEPETNNTKDTNSTDASGKRDKNDYIDGPLTEIGQKAIEENGAKVELMNIINVNETVNVNPIEVTIKDIKLLSKSDIDKEQLEYIQLFVETEVTDPLNYIQVSYVAENTSEEDAGWVGITHVVLSTGEQINVSNNDFLRGSDAEYRFYGKVKKEEYLGVPYKGSPEDIENIKIVVGSSINPDDYIAITKEKQVTYEFE